MTIFIDPTESRQGTNLPQKIIDISTPLPGLESKTGADILVSPLSLPATTNSLLERHCNAGMLIQRKHLMDFPASIVDDRLTHSLMKMLDCSPNSVLAIIGYVFHLDDGTGIMAEATDIKGYGSRWIVTCEGRKTLHHNALYGAIDWYELRGGYVRMFSDNDSFVMWLGKRLDFLRAIEKLEDNDVTKRVQRQKIVSQNATSALLEILPGIGSVRARELIEKFKQDNKGHFPSFVEMLYWLIDIDTELPTNIPGNIKQKIAQYVGLWHGE